MEALQKLPPETISKARAGVSGLCSLPEMAEPEGVEMGTGKKPASPQGEELCIFQSSSDILCDLR